MRKYLLFSALCVTLVGTELMAASDKKPDKLHVVFFQDAAGVQHTYMLDKPVSFSDGLAVRSALIGIAHKEHAKGNASFLEAHWGPQENGSLCYITSRSGGRAYYCGTCGGLGCMSIKLIQ